MDLSKRLQQARQQHQLTQQQLADQLHVSRQTVSGWETDRTYPDIATLIALSDLFELSLDELLRGDSGLVSDMQGREQAGTRARQAYWVLLGTGGILMMLVVGGVFTLP